MTTSAIRYDAIFNAYTDGFWAFFHGTELHECPHKARTLEADAWELAWGRAKHIKEDDS